MNELRASKKQRELLNFISNFIKEHGYGPSYREIMRALDYKSVSTVAVHIDGLIAKGFLRKIDHSARSLEVVSEVNAATLKKDITEHIKMQLEGCTQAQLEIVAKSFKILHLSELEALANKKLARYK